MQSTNILLVICFLILAAAFSRADEAGALRRFPDDLSNLRLVVTDSRLPMSVFGHAAVYDGQDSIYLIGGAHYSGTFNDKLIKYSLESGHVEEVGTFRNISHGGAVMHGDEIIHFGGLVNDDDLWLSSNVSRISTVDGSHAVVSNMESALTSMSVLWNPDAQAAYIFGGARPAEYTNYVSVFRSNTDQVDPEPVARLPTARVYVAAAWDDNRKLAYLFGGYSGGSVTEMQIMIFDPVIENVTLLQGSLPNLLSSPAAAFADLHDTAFIVDISLPKLHAFDAATHQHYSVDVEDWQRVGSSAVVYVKKFDRLYILGGTNDTGYSMDQIAYIDLGSSGESPTTTTERPSPIDCGDGGTRLISDPFCCERFYFCFGGVPTRHDCPEGQRFNPRGSECQDASLVGCRIAFTDV